ncbi:NINE protein [Aquabacterium sp.]|uniref:NINE protein n=1 Tax=Aquabacterium sp. TaxID=1872578 RepID=UPI002B78D0E3|nr:NINE protein [Aquabacterium sp.]HSW06324.1 NINE protein [Aquabacterium sp.]
MQTDLGADTVSQQTSAIPHKACNTCGALIHPAAEICPKCGVRQRTPVSKPVLLLLTFFLGGLGAHKFYTGRHWQGILYLVFCWTYIPGLVALVEFIIYCFTSSERLNEKYTAKGSAVVIIVIAIVAFIFIVGVLAAIALPAYQDYTKKAKASEGIIMAGALRARIVESFIERPQDMSCSSLTCNLGGVDLNPTKYVKRLSSDRSGVIYVEYDEQLFAAPKNVLTITPLIDGQVADLSNPIAAGKDVSWKCGQSASTTVPVKYLPGSCR